MKDYSKAYKAFDIRSVWEEPVDDTFAYSLGKGVGKHLLKTVGEDATFIFASDVREANNSLVYRFLKGLEEGGCKNYVGIGLPVEAVDEEQEQLRGVCSTAILYYFSKQSFDMGAVFTASHNPPEYVGMKIVDADAMLIPSDTLMGMVDEYESVGEIDEEDFKRIRNQAMDQENNSLYTRVEEKVCSFTTILADHFSTLERRFKIVVDFSNGAGVGYEKMFCDEIIGLSHEMIYINEKADSEFSAHFSDTTDPHDYEQLQAKVLEVKADLGVMFDGDGDRLGFVDNTGTVISGDIVGGLIAANMLARGGEKKKVIHDVFYTQAVVDEIQKLGGEAIKCRVGHRFIKESFKEHGALFGGEISGHMFFNEVGGFESPLMALYFALSEIEKSETMAQAIVPYTTYFRQPLRKYKVATNEDKLRILDDVATHFAAYTLDHTDGVGVYGEDFSFVLRMSHTEPVLKMVMEAISEEIWNERIKELEVLIQ